MPIWEKCSTNNRKTTRALGAHWCSSLALHLRERKWFLEAFNGRTSYYRSRRYLTINSSAHFLSHKRCKHQSGALLNACKLPLRREEDKRLEHTSCWQLVSGCAAFRGQVTSLEEKIWKVTYLLYFSWFQEGGLAMIIWNFNLLFLNEIIKKLKDCQMDPIWSYSRRSPRD